MPIFANNFEAFGLDLGDHSLKVVHAKRKSGTPTLLSYGSLPVPEGVCVQGVIKQSDVLSGLIKQAVQNVKGRKINTTYVHACLPETHSFIKLITLEDVEAKELPAAIREELPNHIPIPPDDLYIDWQVVEENTDNLTRVLVGAVPRLIVDSFTACLLAAGLMPVSLQIEAEAILRSLLPLSDQPKTSIAVVDFGATRSSFICFDRSTIQFTITLATSSDGITRIISDQLKLSWPEAEKAKMICGLDKAAGEGIVVELVNQAIDELAADISKSVSYYTEHFPHGSPITSIILCGGGANLKQLRETLAEKLYPITIYMGNPLINLVKNLKKVVPQGANHSQLNFLSPDLVFEATKNTCPLTPAEALGYTTAIGLALSNIT